MPRLIEVDNHLSFSQFSIMNDLSEFVERNLEESDDREHLKKLVKDADYSQGLGFLVLNALWLQGQPVRQTQNGQKIPRDDWSWFQQTIRNLHLWAQQFGDQEEVKDESEEQQLINLSEADKTNILRLLNHMEFFQNTSDYLKYVEKPSTYKDYPPQVIPIGEGDVHLSMSDNTDRKLKLDYQIAGIFHPSDLCKNLQQGINLLDMLTQGSNLVVIGSAGRVVQLIKINNQYYFYDSLKNLRIVDDVQQLATMILQSLRSQESKYAAIDFRVFSFEPRKQYVPPQKILNQTEAVLTREILEEKRNPFILPAKNGDFMSVYFYADILGREKTKIFMQENFESDWTVLHAAIANGRVLTLQALISEGADVNQRTKNGRGYTPLGLATLGDQTRGIELLLESGADTEMPNVGGNKALHLAAMNNSSRAFEILFEHGAELNSTNDKFETPLFLALKNENWDMAERLIRLGATVNKPNVKGITPLHLAAQANKSALIKLLIDAGADIRARDIHGKQPKDLSKKIDIKQLLNSYTRHTITKRASEQIFEMMLPIRQENLSRNRQLFQTSMRKEIEPPLTYKKTGITSLLKPKAIYIEAIHEIFQEKEAITEVEQEYLLNNINDLLKDDNCFAYIDIPKSKIPSFLKKVSRKLVKDSPLAIRLREQVDKGTTLDEFKTLCRRKEITQLQIGGVYGKACVWDAARQLGKNIYAKNLGDKHPRIRYADLHDQFQFEDVYINEKITQGFLFPENMVFPEYVLFPQMEEPHFLENITSPRVVEDFEDEMVRDNTPEEVGLGYDKHHSDVNNPVNHKKINQRVFDCLFGQSIQNTLYPGFFTPKHNDELKPEEAAEVMVALATKVYTQEQSKEQEEQQIHGEEPMQEHEDEAEQMQEQFQKQEPEQAEETQDETMQDEELKRKPEPMEDIEDGGSFSL